MKFTIKVPSTLMRAGAILEAFFDNVEQAAPEEQGVTLNVFECEKLGEDITEDFVRGYIKSTFGDTFYMLNVEPDLFVGDASSGSGRMYEAPQSPVSRRYSPLSGGPSLFDAVPESYDKVFRILMKGSPSVEEMQGWVQAVDGGACVKREEQRQCGDELGKIFYVTIPVYDGPAAGMIDLLKSALHAHNVVEAYPYEVSKTITGDELSERFLRYKGIKEQFDASKVAYEAARATLEAGQRLEPFCFPQMRAFTHALKAELGNVALCIKVIDIFRRMYESGGAHVALIEEYLEFQKSIVDDIASLVSKDGLLPCQEVRSGYGF